MEKHATWISPGDGFQSYGDFKRRVDSLEARSASWVSKIIRPGIRAASWQPEIVKFWMRDSMIILKELVGDVKVADHMKWHPEKVYNSKGQRLYSELWTGDWWWTKQVSLSNH